MLANFINLDGTGVGEETYLLRSHFDVQALKAEFNRCMVLCSLELLELLECGDL